MGLSTKHVSGDQQGFDWPSWGKDTLQPGAPELPKPPPPEPLNCPRCSSANTKFCYYNNYNKSQPRHFCKSCKRHWTKGGTLRNVPVGGGRKTNAPGFQAPPAAPAGGRPNFPASANKNTGNNNNNNGQKSNMSNILYQALIGSPLSHEKSDIININNNNINIINDNNNGGDTSASQDRTTEFDHQFSSFGNFFDMNNNNNNNPMSYQSLIAYDNHYPGNLDSIEESTITTVNNVPWPGPDTGSTLDLPNYWSWSEIDVLASSDHLNLSWDGGDQNDNDDLEIKLP